MCFGKTKILSKIAKIAIFSNMCYPLTLQFLLFFFLAAGEPKVEMLSCMLTVNAETVFPTENKEYVLYHLKHKGHSSKLERLLVANSQGLQLLSTRKAI